MLSITLRAAGLLHHVYTSSNVASWAPTLVTLPRVTNVNSYAAHCVLLSAAIGCVSLPCCLPGCSLSAGKQQQALFDSDSEGGAEGSDDEDDAGGDLGIGSDDEFGSGSLGSSEGEGDEDDEDEDDEGGMSDDSDEQLAIEKHNKLLEKARWGARGRASYRQRGASI